MDMYFVWYILLHNYFHKNTNHVKKLYQTQNFTCSYIWYCDFLFPWIRVGFYFVIHNIDNYLPVVPVDIHASYTWHTWMYSGCK